MQANRSPQRAEPATVAEPTAKPAAKKPAAGHGATKGREKSAAAEGSARSGPREGTTMWAVIRVLEGADAPMSPKEIYAQIAERKLASGLKGKTPEQTVAAALAVAAKRGQHVERAEPGKFQVRKER
jgi:hypothetical protein